MNEDSEKQSADRQQVDRQCVERCLGGDQEAFAMLVDRYEKVIFNVAYRMTGDYDASEDVAQTVFIKAYENLEGYDPKYRFFSWLYRMAVNESLNYLKRNQRTTALSPTMASPDRGPEDNCVEAELRRKIRDAMMALEPEYRILIVMRHYGGRSYREMADALGLPEKKVKSRLFTARHLLKDILAERGVLRHDS
ncbi:MAG: sigma-70 family RNA polymerase sigma factor [bacterium]